MEIGRHGCAPLTSSWTEGSPAGLALLCALTIVVGLVTPGVAQRFEYVIIFDNVVMEGTGTSPDTPELAHREVIGLGAVVAQDHAALSGGLPPKDQFGAFPVGFPLGNDAISPG